MVGSITNQTAALKGADFLTLADVQSEDIHNLLELASQLKQDKYSPWLSGRSLAMIFEKPSTRTRVSFASGMAQLGGHALNLQTGDMQIKRGETASDTAKAISRYVDAIMIRTFSQETVEEWAEAADVPVINGLTNQYHPCQVLADLLTIYEKCGSLKGKNLLYTGDGNNMAHSLLIGAAKVGMNCTVASPASYQPDADIVEQAQEIAEQTGAILQVTEDVGEAVVDADIVYTDVWKSMGAEDEDDAVKALAPYQVNASLLATAHKQPLFMHCLPAHRGSEVSAEVIDGPNAIVFDQAENRLHAQKALLVASIE